MPSVMLPFRCPPDLHEALHTEAERQGVKVGELIRATLGDALGVFVPDQLPIGLAGADESTRRRVHRDGLAARQKSRKKSAGKRKKLSGRKSNIRNGFQS